ncbi:hypothetical protein SNOG_01451 [Parastagonospora nodorum SN15]|uniref:Uncharacterized protein n=1 Tax=Phaeosphaeria nodorum (strain SN15 / ATCC MYA-4574 / FGSC 10173) TaxID=321614 RepID=Q0V3G3_PHANO|nr:hypothetical protein SNOG_01451 [Parastagonospora nodorum SN15]EAT91100.1 hypothetical protein SNOG_01451 [Parastagonospora nodorum SN15]
MGKNTKFVAAFIDDISDSKLSGFPSQATTIAKDQDFRLDMQGVQINNQTRITSLKKAAPRTVAHVLVPTDDSWTPQQIKDALTNSINI